MLSEQANEPLRGTLREREIRIISVQADDRLAAPVRCHADLQAHPLGRRKIVVSRRAGSTGGFIPQLEERGFDIMLSECRLQKDYPGDVLLDAARVGSFLFCVLQLTDPVILRSCRDDGVRIVPVKQGYAKCSVCVVNDTSIITSDPSIAQAAAGVGLSVCRIRAGAIRLEGYYCGFIGGCSGKLGPDIMAFTGDLRTHPDYSIIEAFLRERKIRALSLCPGPLTDIGGILPLEEE